MSVVKIDYGKLSTISKSASSAASKMQDYIDDLTKKVTKKYSDLPGGSSTKTSNSEYYVNQKISQLKKKKEYYSTFSSAISTFSTNAQDIDTAVAKTIKSSTYDFVEKHDYVDVNWWTELKEFFIDLKNICPLFETIGNLIDKTIDGMKGLWEDLKYWYRCGGGKEIVGCVLALVGAIAAVIIAICACVLPICGIVAICAAIGAVLTAINAIVNVITSQQAYNAKKDGDPAWAKIYGERDTAQDVLRQHNFKDGFWNKFSYGAATGLDVVQTVCDLVAIYDGVKNIKNTFKEMKKYANQSKTRNFGQIFKDYVFNKKNFAAEDMRDLIQKRGKIRTLREYSVTKAMSIDQYNKTLTKGQKIAKKISGYAKWGKNIEKYGGKLFDYTVGGNGSFKKIMGDIQSGVSKKFNIPDTFNSLYDLYDKNFKSFKSDYKGLLGT